MKIIFLGTPTFALPTLEALINSHHEILAVVTQPDTAKNRGKKIIPTPVKQLATKHGLKVLQYNKIRVEGVEEIKAMNPDIMVTCAYGQILSQKLIDIPTHGIINVHGSLLPKYRGAAPIQWSVLNGDKKTGITLMKTERGIDTGDMLITREIEIEDTDTSGSMFEKLSVLGGEIILQGLALIESGNAVFTPQDHESATHARMIEKEDGEIDFSKSSREIFNHIRGMNPSPSAYFQYNGEKIKIHASEILQGEFFGNTGEILTADRKNGITIKTADGAIAIKNLQFPNSKAVSDKDFLNGRSLEIGINL
ncbi:MAG: methionyl-tRNA formyltransferase [Bacillota bacterium]